MPFHPERGETTVRLIINKELDVEASYREGCDLINKYRVS
jgi:hypothetical protein